MRVAVPTKLSRDQTSLIEELDATMSDRVLEPVPADTDADEERPFFDRVKDIFG